MFEELSFKINENRSSEFDLLLKKDYEVISVSKY